jgi:hypothetical protein
MLRTFLYVRMSKIFFCMLTCLEKIVCQCPPPNNFGKLNINGSFQKISTQTPRRKFLPSGDGGAIKLFVIIVNVLGHPKGVGG